MFACLVSSPFTYDSFNRLYIAATWHMYQKLVKKIQTQTVGFIMTLPLLPSS